MRRKKKYIFIGAIFLFSFFIFSFFVGKQIFNNFDFQSIILTQRLIPKNADIFLSVFSLLGSVEIISLVLLFALIIFRKSQTFPVLGYYFFGHLIEIIGKKFLYHPGPPSELTRYSIDFLFPTSYVQPGYSYPSGHSYRIVFLTVVLLFIVSTLKISFYRKLILFISILLINFIMLISRISLGEHWLSDVVGGALLGLGFGILSLISLSSERTFREDA